MRVEIMYSRGMYGSDKPNMQKQKDEEFKYPCVYSISKATGELKLWYSNVKKEMFGTPKVIFSIWQRAGIPYADIKGEYGLCEYSVGIIDDPEVLPQIAKAMDSDKFREMMSLVQFSTAEWNRNIIPLFRKDFWKEFV